MIRCEPYMYVGKIMSIKNLKMFLYKEFQYNIEVLYICSMGFHRVVGVTLNLRQDPALAIASDVSALPIAGTLQHFHSCSAPAFLIPR